MATGWLYGGRAIRRENVHLGSCAKMDPEAALQEARAMKANALEIRYASIDTEPAR